MKRIILAFLNFLIIICLASVILHFTVGGYSFIIGEFKISVHSLKTPLFIFLLAWTLRLFYLLVTVSDFRRDVSSFFKTPFSYENVNLLDTAELNIGKNSLVTAFILYLFFLVLQKWELGAYLTPDLSLFPQNFWGIIISLIFIFFIVFFYLLWVRMNFGEEMAMLAVLIFILNPWHTYRNSMISECSIIMLSFFLLAFLAVRIRISPFKFLILLTFWIFLFQGVCFFMDMLLQIEPESSVLFEFNKFFTFFSFSRKGFLFLGISAFLLFWYRQRFYMAIFSAMFLSLLLPFLFPQQLTLYFPYVILFSIIIARGVILILKNKITNFFTFDRNITFTCVVLILAMFFVYNKTNLRELSQRFSATDTTFSDTIEDKDVYQEQID